MTTCIMACRQHHNDPRDSRHALRTVWSLVYFACHASRPFQISISRVVWTHHLPFLASLHTHRGGAFSQRQPTITLPPHLLSFLRFTSREHSKCLLNPGTGYLISKLSHIRTSLFALHNPPARQDSIELSDINAVDYKVKSRTEFSVACME